MVNTPANLPASTKFSGSSRNIFCPAWLRSLHLRCTPLFKERCCSSFFTRLRISTRLVPMQHQLPQVALLPIRSPQPWKAVFQHQLQNVGCIPLVGLLLAHVTGPNLRCISDPDRMPQVLHQLNEPLAVARGLHADQHRLCPLLIKLPGVAVGMDQLLLPHFPRLRIQPTYLLPAGMEITPLYLVCICPIPSFRGRWELDRASAGGRSHPEALLFCSLDYR